MAEQEQNRSEAATPFKLREAKKRGSVPKSADLNSVFVIAALLVCLQLWAWPAVREQLQLAALLLRQSSSFGFSPLQAGAWLARAGLFTLAVLAPLLGAVMLAGALSSLVQHGPVFSVHPIKPDFNRLNPVVGFKRIVSKRALFDLARKRIAHAQLADRCRQLLCEDVVHAVLHQEAVHAHTGLAGVAKLRCYRTFHRGI